MWQVWGRQAHCARGGPVRPSGLRKTRFSTPAGPHAPVIGVCNAGESRPAKYTPQTSRGVLPTPLLPPVPLAGLCRVPRRSSGVPSGGRRTSHLRDP